MNKLLLITIQIVVLSLHGLLFSQIPKQSGPAHRTDEISPDLGVGIIDVGPIKNRFFNNGRFAGWGTTYKNVTYFSEIDLWLGIPEGPWSPREWDDSAQVYISAGPTVSGTFFDYNADTDWGPVPNSRGEQFSGDIMLSDIYPGIEEDAPLLANSSYPLSWVENIYGERVWRGGWLKDPISGQVIPGKFKAGQEVLFELTDTDYADEEYFKYYDFIDKPLKGYAIGARVSGRMMAFDDSYRDNLIIVDLKIVNKSPWDYHDVYLGLLFSPYVYAKYIDRREWVGTYSPRYYVNYIKTGSGDQDRNSYNLAYFYSKTLPTAPPIELFYSGIKLLETPLAALPDGKDNDGDGTIDEPEGEQLGLTGFHWFNTIGWYRHIPIGPGQFFSRLINSPLKRGEIIQYKVLAGDTSGLIPEEQERFFYPKTGVVDPNFDDMRGKSFLLWDEFLMSSGPFRFSSGDTIRFAFALVFGRDLEDLKRISRIAQKIYDSDYGRMEAPYAPRVSAVPGDSRVTLYWDNAAEDSADFLTGYQDFEGYRIYRTAVDPAKKQWGDPIFDGQGKLVGFVPIAQCDLIDNIKGLDPQYPHLNLGSDSGLFHTWTDTTVQNGVTYWYAVCAYDRGIRQDSLLNPDQWLPFRSLENSRGSDPSLYRNLVRVTPGATAANYQTASLKLQPLPGTKGNGSIVPEIIDPAAVTGHAYLLAFDDTTDSRLSYSVIDENDHRVLLRDVDLVHGEPGPIFDGMRLYITTYTEAKLLPDSSGWFNWETGDSSDCNYRLKAINLLPQPILNSYEIRFTEAGDTSYLFHKIAPFEIWDVSNHRRLQWEIFGDSPTDSTDSLKAVWSSGDLIRIRELINGKYYFSWDFEITRHVEKVYTERDTIINNSRVTVIDTMILDNPPEVGDAARIVVTKPFHSGDRFRLETQQVSSFQAQESDLSKIRVVPNPYLVSAAWELSRQDHRLMFTHLPAKCEILIFNVVGDLVAALQHDNPHSGTTFWDLKSHEGMEVVSGLYLYVVKTPQGKTKEGKFVVVK